MSSSLGAGRVKGESIAPQTGSRREGLAAIVTIISVIISGLDLRESHFSLFLLLPSPGLSAPPSYFALHSSPLAPLHRQLWTLPVNPSSGRLSRG